MKKLGFRVALTFAFISLLFTSCLGFWEDVIKGVACPVNSIYLYTDNYYTPPEADNPIEFEVGQKYTVNYEVEYPALNSKEITFYLKSTDDSIAKPVKTDFKTSLTQGSFEIEAVGEGDCQIKMFVKDYEETYPGYDVVYVRVNPRKTVQILDSNGKHLTQLKLYKGEDRVLSYKNTYDNSYVKWSTNNEFVLSVNSSGYIKALSEGNATITLSSWDGKEKDYCDVTVLDSKSWTISITNGSSIPDDFTPGKTYQLECSVNVEGVSSDVYWESDNKAVATVDANGIVKAVSAGTAKIYAVLSENTGVKSSPVTVTVKAPPVASHQFFWGKWTRMDNGKNYEIEETAVIFEGKSYEISSSTDTNLSVSTIGEFTKISDRQINLDVDGDPIPFYRQGGTNLEYTVHVVGFTDEIGAVNGNNIILGRAAGTETGTTKARSGLKVKSKSEKYSTYTDEGTTDENGNVTLKAPVQGDTQIITIEDEITHDIVIVSGLKIDNDGSDMGTIPFVGKNDYSLKVTGNIADSEKNNGYLYGNNHKTYPLTLTITNISEIRSATSSCKIYTDDSKLKIENLKIWDGNSGKFVDSPYSWDSIYIPTMKSGATMKLQLDVSYGDLIENFKNTEIKIEIKNKNTDRVWSDYVPLRFFAGQMPITITTRNLLFNNNASLNGFLIYPDGNSKFFAVPDKNHTTLYVPVFGTTNKFAYKMVFSGATVSGDLSDTTAMCYKVKFNSEEYEDPDYVNWETLYDYGEKIDFEGNELDKELDKDGKWVYKSNNKESNASIINNDFEAYLYEGDIDFYTINVKSESKMVYE